MSDLKKAIFVCLDCETTGLDPVQDRVIEVGCVKFDFSGEHDYFESLIDPECVVPDESIAIHRISNEMLVAKPKIDAVLPRLIELMGDHIIVGHGILFDIQLIINAARKANIPCTLDKNPVIDTLRLARHYGDSPTNSLSFLASHFNVPVIETHRALADVRINVDVFKHLTRKYKTTHQIFDILARPIKMKYMPLGKHKGRSFSEIPLQYLQWAAHMDFDQDLLYSIRHELKVRKSGSQFNQATNPFSEL